MLNEGKRVTEYYPNGNEIYNRNSRIWVVKLPRPPKTGHWPPEKISGFGKL